MASLKTESVDKVIESCANTENDTHRNQGGGTPKERDTKSMASLSIKSWTSIESWSSVESLTSEQSSVESLTSEPSMATEGSVTPAKSATPADSTGLVSSMQNQTERMDDMFDIDTTEACTMIPNQKEPSSKSAALPNSMLPKSSECPMSNPLAMPPFTSVQRTQKTDRMDDKFDMYTTEACAMIPNQKEPSSKSLPNSMLPKSSECPMSNPLAMPPFTSVQRTQQTDRTDDKFDMYTTETCAVIPNQKEPSSKSAALPKSSECPMSNPLAMPPFTSVQRTQQTGFDRMDDTFDMYTTEACTMIPDSHPLAMPPFTSVQCTQQGAFGRLNDIFDYTTEACATISDQKQPSSKSGTIPNSVFPKFSQCPMPKPLLTKPFTYVQRTQQGTTSKNGAKLVISFPISSIVRNTPECPRDSGWPKAQNLPGVQSARNTLGAHRAQNTLGVQSSQNTLGVQSAQNTLGVQSAQNTRGLRSSQNTLGVQSSQNTRGVQSSQNTLGVQSLPNTLCGQSIPNGVQSTRNTIGVQSARSNLGVQSARNNIGVQSGRNAIGVQSARNTFGVQSTRNTFGVQSARNTFGVQNARNTLGVQSAGNTLGVQSDPNVLGVQSTQNTLGVPLYFQNPVDQQSPQQFLRYVQHLKTVQNL